MLNTTIKNLVQPVFMSQLHIMTLFQKQSRPKRKYLGILDDETGEIIPSSGRKGRRSSTPNETTNNTDTNPLSIKIKALEKTISDKNDEITSLKTEIKTLNSVISNYEKICQGIVNTLVSVSGK